MLDYRFAQLYGSEDGTPPVPALVIAVGAFAQTAVQPAEEIYLRGDLRRRNVTRFYGAGSQDVDSSLLVALFEQPEFSIGDSPAKISHAAYQAVVAQKSLIRTAVEQALHNIRTHENLIAAGWSAAHSVPVNIYLLADLTDPLSVGMLLPLVGLVQEICSTDLLCSPFLLLSMAVFPDGSFEQYREAQSRVLHALQDARSVLNPKSSQWQKMAAVLNLSLPAGISPSIFLFDRRKEGAAEVKDAEGMITLVGNGLLALMEGNTARKLIGSLSWQLAEEQTYNSIGAALIAYDPQVPQILCGDRAAQEFIETQLLAEPAGSPELDQEIHRLHLMPGNPLEWFEELISALPKDFAGIRAGLEAFSLRAEMNGLHFTQPNYESLPGLQWEAELLNHTKRLVDVLAEAEPMLLKASRQLESGACAQLSRKAQMIVRLPKLYPGGLKAARKVLNHLSSDLQGIQGEMERRIVAHKRNAVEPHETIAPIAAQMRSALSKISPLPWPIKLLPGQIRGKAAEMYSLWKHHRQIAALMSLRREGIEKLEDWYADAILAMVLTRLRVMIDGLLDVILAETTSLDEMEIALREAAATFSLGPDRAKEAEQKTGWNDLLRLPAFQQDWVETVYRKNHPNFAVWLADYLAADKLFSGSIGARAEAIMGWLAERSAEAFCFLRQLSVDEVLRQQEKDFLNLSERQMAASIPPLRPDYDASGGGTELSTHARLLAEPEWETCRIPQPSSAQWETVFTGNPYMVLWLQARAGIPASSVEAALASQAQSNGHGAAGWSILTDADTEAIWQENSLAQPVSFSWSFRPRGGKNAVHQQINLRIDRTRFEHCRRLPRFSGQWNRYAEEEMPEIRELALAFQSLHARRQWSTYNQASNVLAFVQQCIPYASDQLTTGHQDWARYPIETLADRAGDCEDVAILCAAVLARLGFQVILLVYEQHLAFAVAGAEKLKGAYVTNPLTGARCFYGEATAQGWHLGEVPKAYASIDPLEVLPVSILIDMEPGDEEEN